MINRTNKNLPMYLSICCLSSSSRGSGCLGVSYIWLYLTPDLPPPPPPHRARLAVRGDGQGDDQGWDEHRQDELLSRNPRGRSGVRNVINEVSISQWSHHLSIQSSLINSVIIYQFSHHLFVDFQRPSTTVSLFPRHVFLYAYKMVHLCLNKCRHLWPYACPWVTQSVAASWALYLHLPFRVWCLVLA